MKERPILMNAEMVGAVLGGRKTQTRRVINPQPDHVVRNAYHTKGLDVPRLGKDIPCPFGKVGDQLYVRETFSTEGRTMEQARAEHEDLMSPSPIYYRADEEYPKSLAWKPSIHMPRWASRINLEITDIRVERVQDITKEDALAEGVYPNEQAPSTFDKVYSGDMPTHLFGGLWDSIYAAKGLGWDKNPWVWVVEFKRI